MLANLLNDTEAVIRQHIAGQMLQLSIVAMIKMETDDKDDGKGTKGKKKLEDYMLHPEWVHTYDDNGYQLIINTVIPQYLNDLLLDTEVDVRRAASDALAGLALLLKPEDVRTHVLPIPLRLAQEKPAQPSQSKKRTEAEQRMEELRTTACHLLAELGGAASEHINLRNIHNGWVKEVVLPAVMELCADDSFRVRRSAAQALPRVLGAVPDAANTVLPTFERLSQDDVHRVRKSTGECLVDMSRALMLLAASSTNKDERANLHELRRNVLLPIADRLIQDSHKQVRQGMMQFLGPFMASFYPYQYSELRGLLPESVESDGSHHLGIVAQFFPHASSMVARLNSSQNAISQTPTPVHNSVDPFLSYDVTDSERLVQWLPQFVHASRLSTLSLTAVTADRRKNPPEAKDLEALSSILLDYFAALSVVATGDENTDAEMRVYCAYSFPALVLLLGPEHWEGSMRTCFFTLLNPAYGQDDEDELGPEGPDGRKEGETVVEPPLPVKRCLASSLHTVAHILGPELAVRDVIPAVQSFFLPDADDSVRLNMVRNFASLLSILPVQARREPFLVWSEVVQGESFLGGRKRSSTNPLVLNWRQRSYLARSLPELIVLLPPSLLHEHLWPILQILLTDSINDVRDDALWSIAMLMRAFCPETINTNWPGDIEDPKKFSFVSCNEIVDWVVNNVLISPPQQTQGVRARPANFTDRQVYCRICGSVALALRLSEDTDGAKDEEIELKKQVRTLFFPNEPDRMPALPYTKLNSAEQAHLTQFLQTELLPSALEMKEDRTSNVRITLMKVLQLLPFDLRTSAHVKPVLRALEEECATWTSFGNDISMYLADEQQQAAAQQKKPASATPSSSGPVDVDAVQVTPSNSMDEADDAPDDPSKSPRKKRSPKPPSKSKIAGGADLRTVVFDDGPIGMQLEPTKDERACRIYGFNDFGSEMSPAKASGLIEIGDVIVSVNGVSVESYDHTIDLLKRGGRREIVIRPGLESERYLSDDGGAPSDEAPEKDKRRSSAKQGKVKKKKPVNKKLSGVIGGGDDGGDSDDDSRVSAKSSRSSSSARSKSSKSGSSGLRKSSRSSSSKKKEDLDVIVSDNEQEDPEEDTSMLSPNTLSKRKIKGVRPATTRSTDAIASDRARLAALTKKAKASRQTPES